MKKIIAFLLSVVMVFSFAACGSGEKDNKGSYTLGDTESSVQYKIGMCNYVTDASLDQIKSNIDSQLDKLGKENNVTFKVLYQNCEADSTVLQQIISDFKAENVDLMVGIATPVAMAMQSATDEIPIIFSAVSDPVSTKLVKSLENPGANITGTSDYLDTDAIMSLIVAQNPEIKKVGLLYDAGQDSSTTPIESAKAFLNGMNIEFVEKTGTNNSEVDMAADSLIAEGVEAIFTPTDNTIMAAELTIYDKIAKAKIPHYTGADSFALNGAFLGYGVDYANLGKETADMVADVLVNGKKPATLAVKTFDNGTATINTEICEQIGFDYSTVESVFMPLCSKINKVTTKESFDK